MIHQILSVHIIHLQHIYTYTTMSGYIDIPSMILGEDDEVVFGWTIPNEPEGSDEFDTNQELLQCNGKVIILLDKIGRASCRERV